MPVSYTHLTGAIDFTTDGERMAYVHEGYPMMSKVTAMGCTATGIVGAFLAVNSDPLEASFHVMKAMEIAGERTASLSRGKDVYKRQIYIATHCFYFFPLEK